MVVVKKVAGMLWREPLDAVSHIRSIGLHALAAGLVVMGIAVGMPDAKPHYATNDEAAAPVARELASDAAATNLADHAESASDEPAVDLGDVQLIGNWTWYGYRLNRSETNQIANLSVWNAASGVSGSRLIPYSSQIMRIHAATWVLTARNARSMGQCLAISYTGTGLIVGC